MAKYYYSVYGPYIEQYLEVQKNLGYRPKERNYFLVAFDRLAMERDEAVVGISKELADEWGKKNMNESEINRYKRIQSVRLFALFLCKMGYPSYNAQLPKFQTTFTPYIFTAEQILAFFLSAIISTSGSRTNQCFLLFPPCSGSYTLQA